MKTKNTLLKVSIISLSVLLVLVLVLLTTRAYFTATRGGSGTITISSANITIDYTGFYNNQETPEKWERDVELKLFEKTSGLPGDKIDLPSNATIGVNASSDVFYARVKLAYKFYNVSINEETSQEIETEIPVAESDINKIIVEPENVFGTNWIKTQALNQNWYYYSADGVNISLLDTGENKQKQLFGRVDENDNNLSYVEMALHGYLPGATDKKESGGYVYNDIEVTRVKVYLVIEALQKEANLDTEGWKLV